MKKLILIVAIVAIASPRGWSQAQMVKQRAEQIRDRNNETQAAMDSMPGQGAPTPQAAAPTTTAAPSASQGMDPAQAKLIERLVADLGALKPGTAATADQKTALVNDLTALSKVPVKPSKTVMAKTVEDLTIALNEKALTTQQLTKLARSLNVVLNCSRMDSAHAQTWVAQSQTVLKSVGVGAPTIQSVGTDLGAIVLDIQHTKSKLYQ